MGWSAAFFVAESSFFLGDDFGGVESVDPAGFEEDSCAEFCAHKHGAASKKQNAARIGNARAHRMKFAESPLTPIPSSMMEVVWRLKICV